MDALIWTLVAVTWLASAVAIGCAVYTVRVSRRARRR